MPLWFSFSEFQVLADLDLETFFTLEPSRSQELDYSAMCRLDQLLYASYIAEIYL